MINKSLLAVVSLAALALLAACGPSGPKSASGGATLHRGNAAEPDTLDPHKSSTSWENNILSDLGEGLMALDAGGNAIYGLAASHTVSADGLVWTYTLRDNLVWSDGVPVTAADFEYSFRRMLDPATAAQYASLLYAIKNAQAVNEGKLPPAEVGVNALDAKTVEVRLENPTPYLPTLLAHQICQPVPKHLIERVGEGWVKAGTLVSNGPYTLAEWIPNTHVKAVKNPRYYDADKVKIDTVYYYPISDASIELKRYQAGGLDITNSIPSREVPNLKPKLGDQIHIHPYIATTYIQVNIQKKPFGDVRVRTALSLALDREVIALEILSAGQTPAYAFVPPGMSGYKGGAELKFKSMTMDERRAEARNLLAKAGFGPGHPLRFTYRYQDSLDNRRTTVALQGMWKQVGIEAEILNSESRVHYNSLRSGDFVVADAAWVADYNDAQDFLFLMQSTTGQMNYGKYANPAFDRLMDEAAQTLDTDKRSDILRQAEQIILDDAPVLPLVNRAYRSLVKPYVKGFADNVVNVHRTRFMSIER